MQRLWERVSQTGLVKMPVWHTPEGKSKSCFNFKQLKENQALTQELWYNSISEPSSEIWKTRFILIWHCKRQQKIRCLERDLTDSHLRVSRPPPFELSSQLGLVASLIQFKCTKYFRDNLTLVFEDAQCFNSISEPSSEIWKTRSILIWHCKGQRKIHYLERDLNSRLPGF